MLAIKSTNEVLLVDFMVSTVAPNQLERYLVVLQFYPGIYTLDTGLGSQ